MENAQRKKKTAMLQMLLCAAMWSIGGLFIKLIPWSPLAIAGVRSLIAAIVVLVYMRVNKLKLCINRRVIISAFFLAATFLTFVSATKLTTSANAVVLQYTSPIFIMIISAILFGKKFKKTDIVAVCITIVGMILFFFDQLDKGHALGNIIGFISGITFAAMFVSTDDGDSAHRMSGMFLGHAFTAVVGIPFLFSAQTEINFLSIGYILILGVVQLGIPYVLYGRASENCPPLACSLLAMIEPVLNPIWVLLATGEAPGVFALIGGIVIIATVTVWCIYRDKKENK